MIRLSCLTLLAAAACTGTDVGNPVVDVELALYEPSFPAEPAAAARTTVRPGEAATVTIEEAWVAIDRVRLRAAAACEGQAELEIADAFALDLLAPGPIPRLAMLEVTATDYCRFELRWASAEADELPAGAPAELAGASIYLAGTRGDGAPFVLRSDRGDELRLDAIGGGFPIDHATGALFVAFSGQALLAGVNLEAAALEGGVARIEDGSNDDQLAAFEANLEAAVRLFDDDDNDGELDPDERADPLAE